MLRQHARPFAVGVTGAVVCVRVEVTVRVMRTVTLAPATSTARRPSAAPRSARRRRRCCLQQLQRCCRCSVRGACGCRRLRLPLLRPAPPQPPPARTDLAAQTTHHGGSEHDPYAAYGKLSDNTAHAHTTGIEPVPEPCDNNYTATGLPISTADGKSADIRDRWDARTPVRQTWMAPSQPPLTKRPPSGLTAADARESAWPLYEVRHSGVIGSSGESCRRLWRCARWTT